MDGSSLRIKWGWPILQLAWPTIRFLVNSTYILCGMNILVSLCLLGAAARTKSSVGDFLNMVTDGDGNTLPAVLAVAGILGLVAGATPGILTWQAARPAGTASPSRLRSAGLLGAAVLAALLSLVLLACALAGIVHAYTMHGRLHDGISDAMARYANDTATKARMDTLQVVFQCCGSHTYAEWFDIPWFDSTLASIEQDKTTRDDVPFSCCALRSSFPCVHHGVMSVGGTGAAGGYLYAPEANLSVSERGCHAALLRRSRGLAWSAGLALLVAAGLHAACATATRLLHTAHTPRHRLVPRQRRHTAWLVGCYKGREASTPPPVPKHPPP